MTKVLCKHTFIALLGMSTCLTMPMMAQAQTDTDQATQYDEIIVSARRRKESIQDTPIAMTALPASQLEAKGAINLGDLQGAAPNVLITQQNSGPSAANISIRGLTFADVEKSYDPTVAVVVDGVFIGTSTGQFFDFFDIEQLEVLRGPQGTLFGRNTIGGVINLRRTKPTFESGAKVDFSYGSFNTMAARAVVNVPLIEDRLAAKAFYFHNETDGFHDHAITGEKAGFTNNENFGLVLAYKNDENFDANLTLEKQVQQFDPVVSNISQTGEVFCLFEPAVECDRNSTDDLYTVFGDKGISDYESPAATLEMNLSLGDVTITSVTGYRETDEAQIQDFDASSSDLYLSDRIQTFQQFSQELRAAGQFTDTLDYVAGIYYYDAEYDLFQKSRVFGSDATQPDQRIIGTSKSLAVFGDFNWDISDQFRLSFGGRWTQDKKTSFNKIGATQYPQADAKFNKFTPKVGVDYRPTDNMMLYASWSRGYRSGGFSGRGATLFSSTTPFDPETVDSYEIGLKSDFFDRKLLLNLSAFIADYKDLQQNTTVLVGNTNQNETVVSNVGSASIKGFEVDLTYRATDDLTFTGSLGLLDSKFNDFITQAPLNGVLANFDYSANNLIYNPNMTAAATASYNIPTDFGDVKANASVRYIDEYDQQISLGATTIATDGTVVVSGNDPRVKTDKAFILDASLSTDIDFGDGTVSFTVFGRNLTDDLGASAAFTVGGLWSFASARAPRSFGATIGYEF